jgi:hypothetical protein
MPLRQLLVDHASTTAGPIAPRIDHALMFAEQLKAVGAKYFLANPSLADRLEKAKGMSRNYLAHEYFNRDWTPFYHADVVKELDQAKVSFVGAAYVLEQIDALNLTADQQTLVNSITDPVRNETMRDFIFNAQFRRDIFMKGFVRRSPLEARQAWFDRRFALTTRRQDVSGKVTGFLGEANMQPEIYDRILDAFESGPKTVGQLAAMNGISNMDWGVLREVLTLLVGANHLQPCLPARDDAKRAIRTKQFNLAVVKRAQTSTELTFLASPVTGGGVPLERVTQLFILARATKQEDEAAFAWKVLSEQNHRLMKDGVIVESAEENLAELRIRLDIFKTRLPILGQLGIV